MIKITLYILWHLQPMYLKWGHPKKTLVIKCKPTGTPRSLKGFFHTHFHQPHPLYDNGRHTQARGHTEQGCYGIRNVSCCNQNTKLPAVTKLPQSNFHTPSMQQSPPVAAPGIAALYFGRSRYMVQYIIHFLCQLGAAALVGGFRYSHQGSQFSCHNTNNQ